MKLEKTLTVFSLVPVRLRLLWVVVVNIISKSSSRPHESCHHIKELSVSVLPLSRNTACFQVPCPSLLRAAGN